MHCLFSDAFAGLIDALALLNRQLQSTYISNISLLLSHHRSQREYVTSTKTEKMEITRGIVEHIQTQLNPPGRFLEKDAETGRWKEVDIKRAHEKTAQALRDGAAPLRKRLSDEITSDPLFFANVFDKGDVYRSAKKSRKGVSAKPLYPPKNAQKEQLQDTLMHDGIPSPIFTSTSIDQWLSVPELPLVSPSQSPMSSFDDFGLPFHIVDCKEDGVPIDTVDMLDDEILKLWVSV